MHRSYYQICKVDHQRNQELMVAEVEGCTEGEKLVENFRNNSSEDDISYRVSKMLMRAS